MSNQIKNYRRRVRALQNQYVPTLADFADFEVWYPDGTIGPVDTLIIHGGQTLEQALSTTYAGCIIRVKAT